MLQSLKRLFTRGASSAPSGRRRLRAGFDAAQTTADLRKWWAGADGYDADSWTRPGTRAVLRNRARYEAANNSLLSGIVLTLANNLVGTGPRLQIIGTDAAGNERVEQLWAAWADEIGLAEKLRTMRMARATDGEAFGLLVTNERLEHPIKLDLKLIEADQVETPNLWFPAPGEVSGIKFDEFDNPISYSILKHHPGSTTLFGRLEADEVPAAQMIHYFRRQRPGQHRGLPDILPALTLIAELRRYRQATLAAAELAAEIAGVLKTAAPPGETPEDPGLDELDIPRRALLPLPMGYELQQLKAEQPTATYENVSKWWVNEIARSVLMPLNVALGNSSSYNYASGRLDWQMHVRANDVDRSDIERGVVNRIWRAWLDEAVLIEGFLPQSMRSRQRPRHAWMWDGFPHVDPVKEADADTINLANNTTTLAELCAEAGTDWRNVLTQRAAELEEMRRLGIPIPTSAGGGNATSDAEDEADARAAA